MIPALQHLLVAPDSALPTAQAITLAQTSHTGETTRFAVLTSTPAAARRLRALIPLIDGLTSTGNQLITQGDDHWGGFDLDDGFGRHLSHLPTAQLDHAVQLAADHLNAAHQDAQ
ncbi:hypothetical protein IHN32_00220 [Deinococcus sp. 14RED07]|uniref:hypothetical protein n=1 Tax=unclassified Deinococcus TaxID=2623546 RepID=UPI001E45FBDB|nr:MULTISPECIES: hypothetical protein [unclassified Deinococcus]MCD0159889.1 hypothetical protein [Deinococcus sp. 6YEL10]MCD0164126.1 hypothetical protein [Deinococcus sp. 12RED42]MCD0174382.1 hypothetical protein [Deinococcus sp. 14RED07]